jgi:hypothetical protein
MGLQFEDALLSAALFIIHIPGPKRTNQMRSMNDKKKKHENLYLYISNGLFSSGFPTNIPLIRA